MAILALDTSTLVSSVALAERGLLLAELTLQTNKMHSERLMPHIADLIEKANKKKTDIQAVAASIGPGSFTGLRIGLATAKALAYALKLPIIGVPTMAALAYNCFAPAATIVPILDAQKGNIYYALYNWHKNKLVETAAPEVESAQSVFDKLAQSEVPVVVVGEAAVMYQDTIERYENLALPPVHSMISRAGSVALLGLERLYNGQIDDVEALEPLYIRRSEAETLWEQRHGANS